MKKTLFAVALAVVGLGCARDGDSSPRPDRMAITFEKLIRELTDLDRLASAPNPKFEWRVEAQPAGVAERTMTGENGEIEYVLFSTDGPGAVTQVWLAHPEGAGILRIHLDGVEQGSRLIEMPAAEWFSGAALPAIAPIAGRSIVGGVSWLPIPFAERCVMTTSSPAGEGQVIWRDYDEAAQVETWSGVLSDTEKKLIESAAGILSGTEDRRVENLDWARDLKQWLPPGSEAGISVYGRGAVRRLKVRLEAENINQALADCRLVIRFDQQAEPAVEASLADFFNVLPDRLGFRSLPIELGGDGWMTGFWVMPYARRVEVLVTNQGSAGAGIEVELAGGFRPWDEDALLFHAGSPTTATADSVVTLDPFIESQIPSRNGAAGEFGWWYQKQSRENQEEK